MSGRPTYPTWTVPGFSTDANYPAGANPWNGQPTKVAYPGMTGGFVPNQPNAAQYFNYLHNIGFVTDQATQAYLTALLDFVGQSQGLNWQYKSTNQLVNGGTFNEPPVEMSWPLYDPIEARWVMVGGTIHAGPLGWISHSSGGGIEGGNAFFNPTGLFDSGTDYPMCGAVNPTTGLIVYLKRSGVSTAALPSGSYTWNTPQTLGAGGTGDATYGDMRWFPPASAFLVVSEQGGNATFYKGDGLAPWTDISTLVPVGMRAIPAGQVRHTWHCTNSPTRMLAFEQYSGNSYFSTDDGVTSTSRTLPAGVLANVNQIITAATYMTSTSLFFIVVHDKVALTFKTYFSGDGVSWSLAATAPTTKVLPHCIGAVGTMLLMYGTRDPLGAHPRSKFFLSVDNGATWRETDSIGQPMSAFCNGRIHTDGQRILMNNEEHYHRSDYSAGMPTALV